jgi:hypothetical protein
MFGECVIGSNRGRKTQAENSTLFLLHSWINLGSSVSHSVGVSFLVCEWVDWTTLDCSSHMPAMCTCCDFFKKSALLKIVFSQIE